MPSSFLSDVPLSNTWEPVAICWDGNRVEVYLWGELVKVKSYA